MFYILSSGSKFRTSSNVNKLRLSGTTNLSSPHSDPDRTNDEHNNSDGNGENDDRDSVTIEDWDDDTWGMVSG